MTATTATPTWLYQARGALGLGSAGHGGVEVAGAARLPGGPPHPRNRRDEHARDAEPGGGRAHGRVDAEPGVIEREGERGLRHRGDRVDGREAPEPQAGLRGVAVEQGEARVHRVGVGDEGSGREREAEGDHGAHRTDEYHGAGADLWLRGLAAGEREVQRVTTSDMAGVAYRARSGDLTLLAEFANGPLRGGIRGTHGALSTDAARRAAAAGHRAG